MELREKIESFLSAGPWGVAGASADREKYGNKVLRCYLQNGRRPVYPIHPRADEIEGLRSYPDLSSLPEPVRALSIITPAPITDTIVEDAIANGVSHLWMQPGAESRRAIETAEGGGLVVIAGGACILVAMGYRE